MGRLLKPWGYPLPFSRYAPLMRPQSSWTQQVALFSSRNNWLAIEYRFDSMSLSHGWKNSFDEWNDVGRLRQSWLNVLVDGELVWSLADMLGNIFCLAQIALSTHNVNVSWWLQANSQYDVKDGEKMFICVPCWPIPKNCCSPQKHLRPPHIQNLWAIQLHYKPLCQLPSRCHQRC